MAVWTSYVGLLLGWTQRPFGLMPCSGRTIIWFLRVTPIGNCNYLPARPYLILFFSSFLLYYYYYYHYFFYFIFLPFSRVRIISVPFGRQFIANVKGMVIVPFLWLVGCFFFQFTERFVYCTWFWPAKFNFLKESYIDFLNGWLNGWRKVVDLAPFTMRVISFHPSPSFDWLEANFEKYPASFIFKWWNPNLGGKKKKKKKKNNHGRKLSVRYIW